MIPQPISIDNGAGYSPSNTAWDIDDTSYVLVGNVYLNTGTQGDDSEQVIVTGVSGSTITVTREYNGTTAVGLGDNQILALYSTELTLSQRVYLDLAVLVSGSSLIDLSRQRDVTTSQDIIKTSRVCDMAAGKVESVLGVAGVYGSHDLTIGDYSFLDFGIRLALLYYSQVYSFTLSDKGTGSMESLLAEVQQYAKGLRQEASTPALSTQDNDKLNKRRNVDTWDSSTDA